MEERKGDVRVSIISAVFFTCIVAGAVFLFLYMLLPGKKVKLWYPIVGLILVAVPWLFWTVTCAYRCLKPGDSCTQIDGSGRYDKADAGGGGGGSSHTATTAPASSSVAMIANASSAAGSPVNSPSGNQRHVQFAGVVVMGGNDGNGGQTQKAPEAAAAQYQAIDVEDHSRTNGSIASTESEMPLRLMV
ncbi:uncharacterized protein LOC126802951 [Argentina anserina]|uniref:uncharacterized protein LOC126802951 n=1 Tax=Argentina anserina TaxID=57926 RepID=UPI00217640D6|nr:uncharacterized protein LOC126802951 [Potentilla anserina]